MDDQADRLDRFRWVDLAARDRASAQGFYEELFDWTVTERWVTSDVAYTTFTYEGDIVAGLGEMANPPNEPGPPAAWASYVTVADVTASAQRARELGGKVEVEPIDVFEAGRMAIISDPGGATVSLWQEGRHIGAERFATPGALAWNELNTRKLDRAVAFYTSLFGWEAQARGGTEQPYVEFRLGGTAVAGAFEIRPDMPPDLPDHWLVYFAVHDVTTAGERARRLGAQVLGPMDIGQTGEFAIVEDPQGAHFCLYRSKP